MGGGGSLDSKIEAVREDVAEIKKDVKEIMKQQKTDGEQRAAMRERIKSLTALATAIGAGFIGLFFKVFLGDPR